MCKVLPDPILPSPAAQGHKATQLGFEAVSQSWALSRARLQGTTGLLGLVPPETPAATSPVLENLTPPASLRGHPPCLYHPTPFCKPEQMPCWTAAPSGYVWYRSSACVDCFNIHSLIIVSSKHLLCAQCQQPLEKTDMYIRAVSGRGARDARSGRLLREERSSWEQPEPKRTLGM